MTETSGPGYRVERVEREGGLAALRFAGELRFRQCFESWQGVRELARHRRAHGVRPLRGGASRRRGDGAPPRAANELPRRAATPRSSAPRARAGDARALRRASRHARSARPAGEDRHPRRDRPRDARDVRREPTRSTSSATWSVAAGRRCARPRSVNWADVARLMERAGADGLPIVLMINFLVGLGDRLPGRRPAQAVRRQHLRRRPGGPVGDARARAADDGDHRRRPLGRRLLGRARHDAGVARRSTRCARSGSTPTTSSSFRAWSRSCWSCRCSPSSPTSSASSAASWSGCWAST